MGLTKLGKYIEPSDMRNSEGQFGEDAVVGLSTQKQMITTKADLTGVNLNNYKLFPPGFFAYVPDTSRRGDKMSLAYNNTDNTFLVSSISVVFSVSDEDKLCADYLYMYFNRPEFDRYARFNSWGSARETFSWEDMCDIDFYLPTIDIQRKYADIYKAILDNQKAYESGLEDLQTLCTAYIEKLRRDANGLHKIGKYIQPYNEKNTDGAITLEQGINIDKEFITPQRSNSNLTGRKIVRHGQFAYCTQLNNENVAIAYRTGEDCVVSSVYDIFEITDTNVLLPEYLMLWLVRPEFGRFVYWASEGSAYEFLNYDNLANYKIPVPSIEIQHAIGDLYMSYITRKSINAELKAMIKGICSVLIKGSREEAEKEVAAV
ncbi:MAG: restriction endonuclease subunit S [Lachnospiraceae bacterium]|nr:restriction endonuclease subunit S [Lachnospiraceae bacterium]